MNTKYLFKGLCLAGLTLGLVSCQNDEIESVAVSTTDGSAITLNCVIGSTVESRAMIQLGNQDESAEYFLWNEGDVLWVKNLGSDGTDTDGETYKFEISSDYSDDNPSNSASFVCSETSASISSGDVLCVFYLGSDATEYTTTLSLDQSNWYTFEDYTDEEIEEHFKKNMYMVAKATYSSSGTTLSLEHLTTLIRISYVNATDSDQDISYVDLSGSNFSYSYYVTYDEVYGFINGGTASSSFRNNFNDLTVAAKDSIDFYFLFFPTFYGEFSDTKAFTINVNGEELDFRSSDILTDTFEAGYRYWFDITKTDDGLQWTNYVLEYDEYIKILSETNAALCEYLADELLGAYLDDEGNLWIPTEVVEATTSLSIIANGYDIETLNGLECFTNLESLYVYFTSVTSLDLSSFPKLYLLYCYNNNSLTSLDLSNNISLQQLDCIYNGLTSLDLSNNTSLVYLYCDGNQLTSLDLSNNTSLETLSCGDNENLTELICSGARLDYLYFDGDASLTTLKVDGNCLSALDICDLSDLTELTCGNQTNYWNGEEQTLTLSLLESQATLWYDSWVSLSENYNVELNIVE